MGWSDASITKRYMHVPRELVTAIAAEVGALMSASADDDDGDDDNGGVGGATVPA
jgi:integrase